MKRGKWIMNIINPEQDPGLSLLAAKEEQEYLALVQRGVQGPPQTPPGSHLTPGALKAMGLVGLYEKV